MDILQYGPNPAIFPMLRENLHAGSHGVPLLARMVFGESCYIAGHSVGHLTSFDESAVACNYDTTGWRSPDPNYRLDENNCITPVWAFGGDEESEFLSRLFLPLYWLLTRSGHSVTLKRDNPMDHEAVHSGDSINPTWPRK